MKIVFNCHTEYDLKNQFGWAKKLDSKKQSFVHLPMLLDWFNSLKIPITFALAVGGPFEERLLEYVKNKQIKFSDSSELAIHYHSDKFTDGQWQPAGFLEESAYLDYFQKFEEVFGFKPKSSVFGKWQLDRTAMDFLSRLGIKKDGSFVDSEKVIAKPFLRDNILEVPAASFRGEPVNPFSRLSHFFLLKKIIKEYHQRNLILQIGFHSYDFFRFGERPRLRPIKKFIFKNLLKLIKKYNLEITILSKIEEGNFDELTEIKMPFWGKLFNLLGH